MPNRPIISKCSFAWPASWWPNLHAINITKGCEFDCSYCWAAGMAKRFPNMMPTSGEWSKPDLKHHVSWDYPKQSAGLLCQLLSEICPLNRKGEIKPKSILFSATCDPYQPIARETTHVFLKALHHIKSSYAFFDFEVLILTKSPAVVEDLDLLKALDAEVGFTITDIIAHDLEPNAPLNVKRINALWEVKDAGWRTFVSIEPWMPSFPWQIVEAIVEETRTDRYIIGSLNKNGRPVQPDFYRRELPPLLDWLEREGYPVEAGDGKGRVWIKPELKALIEEAK